MSSIPTLVLIKSNPPLWTAGVGLLTPANETDIMAAIKVVQDSDAVVLAIGIDRDVEREALDRGNTTLPPAQEELALRVIASAASKPVVIVLVNGGILSIDSLLRAAGDTGNVAIIEAFNPAQQGGPACSLEIFFDCISYWIYLLPYHCLVFI